MAPTLDTIKCWPNTRPLLALTGATGFVGRMLLDVALAKGYEVRALARSVQGPRSGVQWVRGDLADEAALAELVAGAEAVIHVAGLVNAATPEAFYQGNVAGTAALIAAAQGAGVRRFVFVSSLAAREPQLSAYGASKAEAERWVQSSGLDWTIVRPPSIYGPRDVDNFELFRAGRLGVIPVPKGGRASMIHVEDLARLLLVLANAGEGVTGRCFEPDDGRPGGWGLDEMARAIGVAVGRRRIRVIGLSPGMIRLGARIDGLLRGPKARLTADRAGYMCHPDWVASEAARPPGWLWEPKIETRGGLAATAEWYRREGWL